MTYVGSVISNHLHCIHVHMNTCIIQKEYSHDVLFLVNIYQLTTGTYPLKAFPKLELILHSQNGMSGVGIK